MKKIILSIIIVAITVSLGSCEIFGFQKATLILENSSDTVIDLFRDSTKSTAKIQITSDSVGIVDNDDNSFSFDLSEEKSVSKTLEWWGYTDGEIKLKIFAKGILGIYPIINGALQYEEVADGEAIADSNTITIKSGETLIINTLDIFSID